MVEPQPRKTMLLYLILLLGLSWSAYAIYMRSGLAVQGGNGRQISEQDGRAEQYGLSADAQSKHLIKLMDLPPHYLPQIGKHRHAGRLIVVGDVHGMKDSLVQLLAKVKYDKKKDHLILAGDIISKGPDSVGVVDLAMELGATSVRGNHEDRILWAYRTMMAAGVDMDAPETEEVDEAQDLFETSRHVKRKDRKLIKALGKHRIQWLEKCPVILRVGKLGNMGRVVVVHAGLAPGVELEKQDSTLVMNMRTIGKHGVPSDSRDGLIWVKPWNEYQKSLPHHKRTTVIYGHDSHRGLQMHKYSMGIDTACLKGGQLTAVIIEGGDSDHTSKIVQVDCKDGRSKTTASV